MSVMYNTGVRKVDKEKFISTTKTSLTMAEAAAKLKLPFNTFRRYAVKFNCYNPNRGGKGTKKPKSIEQIISLEDILDGKHKHYQTYKLKRRLLAEGIKENKCEVCGVTEWNGKPLNMELHHKDGNKYNHSLENLLMICPNCHSQTDNFRAKNKLS